MKSNTSNTTHLQENLRKQNKVPEGDKHPIYPCYIFQSSRLVYFIKNDDNTMARNVPDENI